MCGSRAAAYYVIIQLLAMVAAALPYVMFGWRSGGITVARIQAAGLTAFSTAAIALITTISWKLIKAKPETGH